MRSLIAFVVFALLSLQFTAAVALPNCGHAGCAQAHALEHGASLGTTLEIAVAAGLDGDEGAIDFDCTHCHAPTFSAASNSCVAWMPELVAAHAGEGFMVFPALTSERPERPQWGAPMWSGQDFHT